MAGQLLTKTGLRQGTTLKYRKRILIKLLQTYQRPGPLNLVWRFGVEIWCHTSFFKSDMRYASVFVLFGVFFGVIYVWNQGVYHS